jgi:lipoprotein signal peptidase
VSDYLDLEVRGLLLAFNIADLALLLGVSTVFASVIVRRLRRISLERA